MAVKRSWLGVLFWRSPPGKPCESRHLAAAGTVHGRRMRIPDQLRAHGGIPTAGRPGPPSLVLTSYRLGKAMQDMAATAKQLSSMAAAW